MILVRTFSAQIRRSWAKTPRKPENQKANRHWCIPPRKGAAHTLAHTLEEHFLTLGGLGVFLVPANTPWRIGILSTEIIELARTFVIFWHPGHHRVNKIIELARTFINLWHLAHHLAHKKSLK